ncbi:kelch repeat-containing protein, partial [Archangium violaceum]
TAHSGRPLASAELYDPASDSWSLAPPLDTARAAHTATLLPSGKVLLAGGRHGSTPLRSAELYDPAEGTWSRRDEFLATSRYAHTATLLPSGQVLLAGGSNGSQDLDTAEVYDLALDACSHAQPLATARSHATATLLPSGQVLIAGGVEDSRPLASAQISAGPLAFMDETSRPEIDQLPARKPEVRLELTGRGLLGGDLPQLLSLTAVEGGALKHITQWESASDTGFTVTLPSVRTGYYILTVTHPDTSGGQLILVDETRPAAPRVKKPLQGQEFFTRQTPEISGTTEPGTTVTVMMDGVEVETVPADDRGDWSYTSSAPLALKPHALSVTSMDKAGNVSEPAAVDFLLSPRRSHYGWNCASAPALPASGAWLLVALLLRRGGARRPTPRQTPLERERAPQSPE